MSGRSAKQLRRKFKQAVNRRDAEILPELKAWINQQDVKTRIRIAWRILWGGF